SVWGGSAIAGPALGGALAAYPSWHWIFLTNLPLDANSISLIYLYLRARKPKIINKIKYLNGASMLVTTALLMYGLLQCGQAWPWLSFPSLCIGMLCVVLLGITIRLESRNPEPILPKWVWENRVLLGTNLALVGMGMTMMVPSL